MTKPTTASPSYLLHARVPHSARVLSSLVEVLTLRGFSESLVSAMSVAAAKFRAWQRTKVGEEPTWLVTADRPSIGMLKQLASTIEQGGGHEDLVIELRGAATAMSTWLGEQPKPVSAPAAIPAKPVKKEQPPSATVRVCITVDATSYDIAIPAHHADSDLVRSLVREAVHYASDLAVSRPGQRLWENAKQELGHVWSRLRALGALNAGGSTA